MRGALDGRSNLGADGEQAAAEHLARSGYRILERNLRSRFGEIDIVAQHGGVLVFVEVRTRRSRAMAPEESITPAKSRRLALLGTRYLQEHHLEAADWRIDVIAIERNARGALVRLAHHISAIEEPPG